MGGVRVDTGSLIGTKLARFRDAQAPFVCGALHRSAQGARCKSINLNIFRCYCRLAPLLLWCPQTVSWSCCLARI